jgi:GT2 family glycosyltransferase
VYPYIMFHHIDRAWALKPGDDYKTAPVQQRYTNSPGGIFVMRRHILWRFGGFDEAMSALGYDDTAFCYAAQTLGTVKRVPGIAWSFNHATNADGKPDRDFSETNLNLPRFRLYEQAAGNPTAMRALITK